MAKKHKVPKGRPALQTKLGAVIRSHRQQLGITQQELASRAGMHRTYLADVERGARNITLRSIASLAHGLRLTMEGLLFHAGDVGDLLSQPTTTSAGGILLIEDKPRDVKRALQVFKQARITNPVTVIQDGEEAVQYLLRSGRYERRVGGLPQLVLLSLDLKKLPGLTVLERMRAHKPTRFVPVITLTASSRNAGNRAPARLRATHGLLKPVRFENLAPVVGAMKFHWTLVPPATSPRSKRG